MRRIYGFILFLLRTAFENFVHKLAFAFYDSKSFFYKLVFSFELLFSFLVNCFPAIFQILNSTSKQ